MTLAIFDTRTMLAALEQRKPPRTFFLDTFFRQSNMSNDKYVDIDIWKGKRRLAPFVSPVLEGKVVEKRGFKTYTYEPPYIKPKMVTTAAQLLQRAMGQHIYSGNMGPAQKAAQQVGKDLAELDEMILRREEWMAAQVLTTGKVICIGDGVSAEIDFLMDATHLPTLSGTALWTDHTNATPLDDLDDWCEIVSKDSGIVPTDCVMGRTAKQNFMKCDQVIGTSGGRKGLFDLRRINVGEINPRQLGNGVRYIGNLTELNLDIWTYDEYYVDEYDNDTERAMMPENKILLGNPAAYTRRQYGAIQDLDAIASVPRFPSSWVKKDPSARFVMLQSAPLPSLHQVDAFLCAQVTA